MDENYNVLLKDPTGSSVLAVLGRYRSLYLTVGVGIVGMLAMDFPYDTIPFNYLPPDGIVEVWRKFGGLAPYQVGEKVHFIRVVDAQLDSSGQKLQRIESRDSVDILNRRVIPYIDGTSQAQKSGPVDNMMKDFVSDNLGAGATDWLAGTGRATSLSVQTKLGLAPTATKAAGARNVLSTLQELALAAYQSGLYTVFDVVSLASANSLVLELRTYVQQRGVDHRFSSTTASPVLLSAESGNLANVEFLKDWTGVVNTAYAGHLGYYSDAAGVGIGPYGRSEAYVNPLQDSSQSGQTNEAALYVRDQRIKRTWSARFVDTPGCQFGRDINFGDFVTAQFGLEVVDVRIDSFAITHDSGEIRTDLILRSDG
jgi:hypothetical protein